jgi:hypothetical protein
MPGASQRPVNNPEPRGFPIQGLTAVLDAVGGFVPLPFVHPVSHAVTNALERSEVCMSGASSCLCLKHSDRLLQRIEGDVKNFKVEPRD